MVKIINNKITLTKGDSFSAELLLTRDGESYTPEADDEIRFAVSTTYVGQVGYELLLTKTVSHEDMMVSMTPEETDVLTYRTYVYDVQITHGDGTVDTVVCSTLTITGEAE